MARLILTLRWFKEWKPDAPILMLDNLSEYGEWETVQDDPSRACA